MTLSCSFVLVLLDCSDDQKLARLGSSISWQNALMVAMLLGGVRISHDDAVKIPDYLLTGEIPVKPAMPPYSFWEKPPAA